MAIKFNNIHSLKKLTANKKEKKENANSFPFEREYNFEFEKIPLSNNSHLFDFPLNWEDIIFFDTETTGLSHGAGNTVFLAGIAYFENNIFKVKQYFVENPSIEAKLIEKTVSLFKQRKTVVTYNGKCFDIPIIKVRCLMNGIEEPSVNQIDLYHISRFVWKNKLNSFKLTDLEREILKSERINDLPGSMAPFAYRMFLLRGETELLEKVFAHNLKDIISLYKLFVKIHTKDFYTTLASARKLIKNKKFEQAIELLRESLNFALSLREKKEVYKLASYCLKKTGKWEACKKLWVAVGDFESFVELSKYYEHREKDMEKALKYALKAEAISENRSFNEKEDLKKRIARILLKKQKTE